MSIEAFNTFCEMCRNVSGNRKRYGHLLTTLMRTPFSFPYESEMRMQLEFSAVSRDLVENFLENLGSALEAMTEPDVERATANAFL